MNFGEKQRARVSINITSLVDILIVLLLFFMLTTQFVRMEILNINIAGNNEVVPGNSVKDSDIIIILLGKSRFSIAGNEFNLLQLKEKLKPILDKATNKNIIIISKPQAVVQDVVSAIDYIKAVGGKNISLAQE